MAQVRTILEISSEENRSGSVWRKCGKRVEIIIRRTFIRDIFAAMFTGVMEHPSLLPVVIERDRTHGPATRRGSVPGAVSIDMLAPKTARAVVTVRTAREGIDVRVAMRTDKGLLAGDEDHRLTR